MLPSVFTLHLQLHNDVRRGFSVPQVVTDGGERTVYIHNISSSDTIKLREDLRNLLRIKNFLPLMNRVRSARPSRRFP